MASKPAGAERPQKPAQKVETALDPHGRDMLRAGVEGIVGRSLNVLAQAHGQNWNLALLKDEISGLLVVDLTRYIRELELWNTRLGLIEASGHQIINKHILDSLAPLSLLMRIVGSLSKWIGGNAWQVGERSNAIVGENSEPVFRIADVGSGAGLPGLPIALGLRAFQVLGALGAKADMKLIEKQQRRVGFLINARAMLQFGELGIDEGNLEEAAQRVRSGEDGKFHLVCARAFRPLEPGVLKDLRSLAGPEGTLFLYKGRMEKIREELDACGLAGVEISETDFSEGSFDNQAEALIVPVKVPFLDDERHIVLIRGV